MNFDVLNVPNKKKLTSVPRKISVLYVRNKIINFKIFTYHFQFIELQVPSIIRKNPNKATSGRT